MARDLLIARVALARYGPTAVKNPTGISEKLASRDFGRGLDRDYHRDPFLHSLLSIMGEPHPDSSLVHDVCFRF